MKRLTALYFKIGLLLVFLFALSCTETSNYKNQTFSLKRIAAANSGNCIIGDGKGFTGPVLKVKPSSENASVTIWKTGDKGSWKEANYFVFEVFGDNDYSGVITLEFYKETKRTSEKIVLQSGEVAETEKESPWL